MPDVFIEQSCDTGVSQPELGRALVPLTLSPRSATVPGPAIRPDARFVAQLIATATHLPQTRAHHRAAPEDVATTYSDGRARGGLPTPANGLALSLDA
jgi:hypothetical protein